ncbi:translation initiation factor IF-2-like [Aquila chrysaetos chrysaetos]|uniref:translation initiation factor IF-2-like n=1 Tax=Aquila chrysaetos chrysaetos TaxID=223781 RepID=UPI0011772F40|nr:translation initiation factor IF-2-like [Aquila chrysaetos chrysaetos]
MRPAPAPVRGRSQPQAGVQAPRGSRGFSPYGRARAGWPGAREQADGRRLPALRAHTARSSVSAPCNPSAQPCCTPSLKTRRFPPPPPLSEENNACHRLNPGTAARPAPPARGPPGGPCAPRRSAPASPREAGAHPPVSQGAGAGCGSPGPRPRLPSLGGCCSPAAGAAARLPPPPPPPRALLLSIPRARVGCAEPELPAPGYPGSRITCLLRSRAINLMRYRAGSVPAPPRWGDLRRALSPQPRRGGGARHGTARSGTARRAGILRASTGSPGGARGNLPRPGSSSGGDGGSSDRSRTSSRRADLLGARGRLRGGRGPSRAWRGDLLGRWLRLGKGGINAGNQSRVGCSRRASLAADVTVKIKRSTITRARKSAGDGDAQSPPAPAPGPGPGPPPPPCPAPSAPRRKVPGEPQTVLTARPWDSAKFL